MSIPYQSDRYKQWVTIHDASGDRFMTPLGVAVVHHWKPIVSLPCIGRNRNPDEPYWFEVQSLNDADDPNEPDSCGHFGFINLWPAVQWAGRNLDTFAFFAETSTEAVYGTHLAFDTLPKCPFLTCEDWGHRHRLEQVRQLFRYATLHPSGR